MSLGSRVHGHININGKLPVGAINLWVVGDVERELIPETGNELHFPKVSFHSVQRLLSFGVSGEASTPFRTGYSGMKRSTAR